MANLNVSPRSPTSVWSPASKSSRSRSRAHWWRTTGGSAQEKKQEWKLESFLPFWYRTSSYVEPNKMLLRIVSFWTHDSWAAYATPPFLGRLNQASAFNGMECISPIHWESITVVGLAKHQPNTPSKAISIDVLPDPLEIITTGFNE